MANISNRSKFIAAFLAVAAFWPVQAAASERCDATNTHGVARCETGLQPAQIEQIQMTQEKSKWCWAASIAMVLAHHGMPISQSELVSRQLGDLSDRAVSGSAITRVLGSAWQEGAGRGTVSVAVSDKLTGRNQIGEHGVVNELAQQRPLIIGADGHAMVLVRVQYEVSAGGGVMRIVGGTVIDPAPGRGVRALQAQELNPSYLAAMQLVGKRDVTVASNGRVPAQH